MFSQYTIYQWNNPTALMLGEFNTFTNSNVKQVKDSIRNIGQVCIQISDVDNTYIIKKDQIINKLNECGISYNAKYIIIQVPNITDVIL
jgi:hypothetical protein